MKTKVKCTLCATSILRHASKSGTYFCSIEHKARWQVRQREAQGFTKEWLHEQYFTLGKSSYQIAAEIRRDPKRVWEWMRDYGFPIKPRGTDYGQNFKKGQESAFKGRRHTEENKQKYRDRRLADGHVPYLINGVHWLKATGRKPSSWRGGITPERQAFYSSLKWVAAVKVVWKRDKGVCVKCGKIHNDADNRGKFHIHHIVSFMNKDLRADPKNLVLLCRKCHLFVHSRKNVDKLFIRGSE